MSAPFVFFSPTGERVRRFNQISIYLEYLGMHGHGGMARER